VIDRQAEQLREHLRPRSAGVLGDVRHRQPLLDCSVDGCSAALLDELEVPLLGDLANRARADERVDGDGNSGAL
jgi:hypothetical protein